MSSPLYEMNMDVAIDIHEDIDTIMDRRDILARYGQWEAESDSEIIEGEDKKENEEHGGYLPPSQVPRPTKRTSRQLPSAASSYRLGPRKEPTDKGLDFVIYRDETADEVPPFRRDYYGSNLPALGEIHNGVGYKYSARHEMRRESRALMANAAAAGDEETADYLWEVAQDLPRNLERLAGAYVWDVDCDPLDVWLWVQHKGYDRRWSSIQKERFVEFLEWMKPLVERIFCLSRSKPEDAKEVDKWSGQIVEGQFDSLGLSNLVLKRESVAQVTFIPVGEDEQILHRADFTEEQQAFIDAKWRGPGRWAPGEEAVPPMESDQSEEEELESEVESEDEWEEEGEAEDLYGVEGGFEGDDLIAF